MSEKNVKEFFKAVFKKNEDVWWSPNTGQDPVKIKRVKSSLLQLNSDY